MKAKVIRKQQLRKHLEAVIETLSGLEVELGPNRGEVISKLICLDELIFHQHKNYAEHLFIFLCILNGKMQSVIHFISETGRQNQNTRSTGNRSLRSASSGRSPAARKQPAGSNVRRQNSRRNEDRRRESNAEKRRQEERKESLAEKRRLENKRRAEEEKRREIQRILTIDDPKEQVNRFLRMMDDKRYSEYKVM